MKAGLRIFLQQATRNELIDKITRDTCKLKNQATEISRLTNLVRKYKFFKDTLKKQKNDLDEPHKNLVKKYDRLLSRYNNDTNIKELKNLRSLVTNYQLEVSDLKDEIDDWTNRYKILLAKFKKRSK